MRTTYLKIYQDALRHNLRAIRALVPKETETVAVVKANAYGYGAVLVAGMAMEEGSRGNGWYNENIAGKAC